MSTDAPLIVIARDYIFNWQNYMAHINLTENDIFY